MGYPVEWEARIWGPFLKSIWDFGDRTGVTNRDNTSHHWSLPGISIIRLIACNDSFPDGVASELLVEVSDALHQVNEILIHRPRRAYACPPQGHERTMTLE